MKFSKAFKYQFSEMKPSVIIFCLIMLTINVVLIILSATVLGNVEGSVTGLDVASIIFLFILSMCIFSTNFSFLNQHGVSRKTMLLSCFTAIAAVAGIILSFDAIYATVFYIGDFFESPYLSLYEMMFHQFESPDHSVVDKTSDILINLPTFSQKFGRVLENLLFNYLAYIGIMITGYFTSIVFYRLTILWRVIVFIIIPTVILNSSWVIYNAGKAFFDSLFGWLDRNILNSSAGAMIFMVVWSAVFGVLSYILARKANLNTRNE